jgi:molybdenum cofactor guanylyltransferase
VDRPLAAHAVAAVVLAGGAGRRLGGVDKPSVVVGGRSLAASVVAAAISAGVSRAVVVGPVRADLAALGVSFTTEEPPGGGPVPALRAGLELVSEPWVLLLAGDLPFLTGRVLGELVAARPAVLFDDSGRPQWLVSCWRMADLRTALGSYAGSSLRGLLSSLPYSEVTVAVEAGGPPCWMDCDTYEDLAAARSFAAGTAAE